MSRRVMLKFVDLRLGTYLSIDFSKAGVFDCVYAFTRCIRALGDCVFFGAVIDSGFMVSELLDRMDLTKRRVGRTAVE